MSDEVSETVSYYCAKCGKGPLVVGRKISATEAACASPMEFLCKACAPEFLRAVLKPTTPDDRPTLET